MTTTPTDSPRSAGHTRTAAGLASELRVAVMRLRRRLAVERHPDNELSFSMMAVLGVLHRAGEMSLGELARHERVQPPSMSRTVASLADQGYVTRRPHDTDGRQVVVGLSGAGEEILRADRRRRDAWLATRLAGLTPDERDTLRRAAPIIHRLAQGD